MNTDDGVFDGGSRFGSGGQGSDAICGTLRHTPPIQGRAPCAGNESLLNHAEKPAVSSRTVNVRSGHIDRDRCKACHRSLPSPGADLGAGIPPQMPAPRPRRSPLVGGAFFYQLNPSRRGSRTRRRSDRGSLEVRHVRAGDAVAKILLRAKGILCGGAGAAVDRQQTRAGPEHAVRCAADRAAGHAVHNVLPARTAGDPRAARGGWLRRITASCAAPGSRPDALRRCRFPAGIRIPSAPAAAGSSGCFRCGHRSAARTTCHGRRPG